MPSDYQAISREHELDYGRKIGKFGEIIVSLYTDKTHFIYELLQNAEDALSKRARQANASNFPKKVSFSLYPDRLEFRHFGKLFDTPDVVGICSIGEGTKPEDLTQIGKFGIGFKSVYAFTHSPEIHSGDEHFRIERFVHPFAVEPISLDEGETLIVLPLNHPQVVAAEAFTAIARRLQALGLDTLLFLPQTEEIEWMIEGVGTGTYLRESTKLNLARRVSLLGSANGNEQDEEWLVFEKPLDPNTENSLLQVQVAYRFVDDHIVPHDHAKLAVYFPTEKETHLKFLIQGPYRTNPARDNIPISDSDNQRIALATAKLVAETLDAVREMNLVNISFLETLPIEPDAFRGDSLFKPIYESVKNALKTRPLLPTYNGTFVGAENAKLARGSALRNLLNDEQLKLLYTANQKLTWLTDEITFDKTRTLRDYLVGELEIDELTPEAFARRFSEEFIRAQSDEWVVEFYAFLNGQTSLWSGKLSGYYHGPLLDQPFIRLEDGTHVQPFRYDDRPNAFLPPDGETNFPIVRRRISSDKRAVEFLKRLPLSLPNSLDEVFEFVLPRYRYFSNGHDLLPSHAQDIRKIFIALRSSMTPERRQELYRQLRDTAFLAGKNPTTGKLALFKATTLYFELDTLLQYFRGNRNVYFVTDPSPNGVNAEAFRKELSELDVASFPRKLQFSPNLSPTYKSELRHGIPFTRGSEFERDFHLDGLEHFLKSIGQEPADSRPQRAQFLWDLLLTKERDEIFFSGVYRWKRVDDYSEYFDAAFLKLLQSQKWLPSAGGELVAPGEILLADLPKAFRKSEWLADKLKFKPSVIKTVADVMGLDADTARFLLQHKDKVKEFLESLKGTNTPDPAKSITDDSNERGERETRSSSAGNKSSSINRDEEFHATSHSGDDTGNDRKRETGQDHSKKNDEEERQKQHRYLTYVTREDTAEKENNPERAQHNREIEFAAMNHVLKFESENNRPAEDVHEQDMGYDIVSTDSATKEKRFIEVKGLSALWGASGVGMTDGEFKMALKLGDQYWLYVVERANADDYKIYPIQDPARLVQQFMYDHNWRALAKFSSVESADEISQRE